MTHRRCVRRLCFSLFLLASSSGARHGSRVVRSPVLPATRRRCRAPQACPDGSSELRALPPSPVLPTATGLGLCFALRPLCSQRRRRRRWRSSGQGNQESGLCGLRTGKSSEGSSRGVWTPRTAMTKTTHRVMENTRNVSSDSSGGHVSKRKGSAGPRALQSCRGRCWLASSSSRCH